MQFCAYMYYLTSKSEMKSMVFKIQYKNVYFVFIWLHILITVTGVRKITPGIDFCFGYGNSHRLEFCVVLFVPFGALEICCFQCHFTITSSLPHHKLIKGDMSCIFSILFNPLNCEYTGHLFILLHHLLLFRCLHFRGKHNS